MKMQYVSFHFPLFSQYSLNSLKSKALRPKDLIRNIAANNVRARSPNVPTFGTGLLGKTPPPYAPDVARWAN